MSLTAIAISVASTGISVWSATQANSLSEAGVRIAKAQVLPEINLVTRDELETTAPNSNGQDVVTRTQNPIAVEVSDGRAYNLQVEGRTWFAFSTTDPNGTQQRQYVPIDTQFLNSGDESTIYVDLPSTEDGSWFGGRLQCQADLMRALWTEDVKSAVGQVTLVTVFEVRFFNTLNEPTSYWYVYTDDYNEPDDRLLRAEPYPELKLLYAEWELMVDTGMAFRVEDYALRRPSVDDVKVLVDVARGYLGRRGYDPTDVTYDEIEISGPTVRSDNPIVADAEDCPALSESRPGDLALRPSA
jgi:hypothetical protein